MRRLITHNEATMQVGRQLAPYHGTVAPPWVNLVDGAYGACPRKLGDWGFVPGLPPPTIWCPCDDSGSPPGLVDRGTSGLLFTPTGSVLYNQTVSGSTLPWVSVPSATANGFALSAGAGMDPGQAVFVVFDAQFSVTGGNRTIFLLGPNLLLQVISSGFAQLFATGSSLVAGATDYRAATGRRYCLYWEPGNFGPGNLPVFKLWTAAEQIQVTAGSGPGGVIAAAGAGSWGPAASSGTSPPAIKYRGVAAWVGWHARIAANLGGAMQGGKFILQRSGLAVAY